MDTNSEREVYKESSENQTEWKKKQFQVEWADATVRSRRRLYASHYCDDTEH